ncbi:MAG: TolC family outer membrane protein [Gammaproteobacteria bacterium]
MLRRILTLTALLLASAPLAHATDLLQVWQLAKANDPAFQQALANRNASMEAKPEAWANLFPSIDLTASRTWNNDSDSSVYPYGTTPTVNNTTTNTRYTQWEAKLTQTLFNWGQFKAVQGADHSVVEAQATYEAAFQGLIVSVSQAYFNVLNAQDNLNADTANMQALSKQYEQSQQQYNVGLIAVTGVKQSEAGYDQARALVIADRQALAQAREALRAITGRYIPDLQSPRQNLPLHGPQPEDAGSWVKQGLESNPNLIAAQQAQKVAEAQIGQQESGYLPSLNLVLSHTRSSTTGRGSNTYPPPGGIYPNEGNGSDNSIGLQVAWNIFSGGATRALTKQYRYQADAAMAQEITQRRSVEQQVRNAYLAVLSGIASVKANRQSVEASQVSLQATEAGLKVGTQTTLDVLTARKTLLDSQKAYYNARYTYMVAVLQLEQAAGTLNVKDIQRLNALLAPVQSTPVPGTTPAVPPATTDAN